MGSPLCAGVGMYPYLTTMQVGEAAMSINTINGAENRERVLRAPLENLNSHRNVLRTEQMRDRFDLGEVRLRGLDRLGDGAIATGANTNGNGNAVGDKWKAMMPSRRKLSLDED